MITVKHYRNDGIFFGEQSTTKISEVSSVIHKTYQTGGFVEIWHNDTMPWALPPAVATEAIKQFCTALTFDQ
ncbi:hypothetical protein KAR91_61835 [Candidatus Pacearchaeota archaeon]|nr:hypothetical protein [Candidatus Pacearchaeota archaeon]